jgi:PKD repeat protein
MYSPGLVAGIFIILILSTAGCSGHPSPANTTGKQGVAAEVPAALPPLPEQYNAVPAVTPQDRPAVTTPAVPEEIPLIEPAQISTINGTSLSNSSNSTSGTTTTITGATVPVAQFTAGTAMGYAPLNIQFTDASLNNPSVWSWDFGDGASSFLQNPSHTYSAGGQFPVTLTAANSAGSDSFSSNISVFAPAFTAIPDHGAAPLAVTFTDTGSGYPPPTAWLWDFGDGITCPSQNKIHTYVLPGTYDVKLRITGPAGSVWVNRTSAVTVT